MRVLVFILATLFSNTLLASAPAIKEYADCRFSIEVPAQWVITQTPLPANQCDLKLVSTELKAEVNIKLSYKEFLATANESGFDFFNGEWITVGRLSTSSNAKQLKFGEWEGLLGNIESGCHDQSGLVGLCSHTVIVLRESELIDGTTLVITGNVSKTSDLEQVYQTLKPIY